MGKKGDLRDFEHGMVVTARQAGLSNSESADLQSTFPQNHLWGLQRIGCNSKNIQ